MRRMSLLQSFQDGRTDLVFDLLAEGKSAGFAGENGVSLLQTCAYFGDVSAIKFLLSNGAKLETLGENLGLNAAVFHGHWRLCQFLLERGADANHADAHTGETPLMPLHRAAAFGDEEAIQMLLEAGAFKDAKDMNGDSPLGWASWYDRPAPILQKLCYGNFRIRPDYAGMGAHLQGEPHFQKKA
jgi:ankyrin repeat protein